MARLGAIAALLALPVSLPLLYAAGAMLGMAEVVALTSAAANVPTAVGPVHREWANAWLTGAETVCNEFAGPFVGELLVAVGAGVAPGATGIAYGAAMLVLLLLAGRFRRPRLAPRSTSGSRPGSEPCGTNGFCG